MRVGIAHHYGWAVAVTASPDHGSSTVAAVAGPVTATPVRAWPPDFPGDIATQRRLPYESRADSVMYGQVLAQLGHERG